MVGVPEANKATHTTGLWKLSALFLNSFIASLSVDAPLIMEEMAGWPTYCRIVWS